MNIFGTEQSPAVGVYAPVRLQAHQCELKNLHVSKHMNLMRYSAFNHHQDWINVNTIRIIMKKNN